MPFTFNDMLVDGMEFGRAAWHHTSTVRLRVVRSDGDRDFLVEGARQHQITVTEAESSGGAYTTQDCVWNLPAENSLYTPEVGYLIVETEGTDRGKTWTILQADRATWKSRHRLTCRDLVLSGLTHAIDIWQPTDKEDAAGGHVNTFLPLYLGVQARVQETGAAGIEELGKIDQAFDYRVFVGRRVYVDAGMQVRWRPKAGDAEVILEIVSQEEPESLDRLMVLNCRRGMW